ncbi:hypothetical protein M5K25_026797 [Dendrobium thyrsiflorum]|uniref:Transcriptional coactivator Hfi1/Transcriptional adapter 1 n=1 Tax=Dendrobium thyrsiflorum TaxID=117978 RepID=A0ABD0TYG4_DENTH
MPQHISPQQGRINLSDLKLQIAKQLGPDRTRMYFGCLNRFLAQKLTKTEFNKLCFLILGRESIPLHNELIRSILKNAYEAKTPPPVGERIVLNQTGAFVKKSLHENDPLSQSQTATPSPLIHCNGDILPPSPRKKRTRKSPLGSNGTANVYAQQSFVPSVERSIKENGTLGPGYRKRPVQHYQSGLEEQPAKVPRAENSLLHDQISLHRRGLVEAVGMEEDVKLKESNDLNSSSRPLPAPLVHAQESFVPSDQILIKEDGILGPCDRKNTVQHYQSGFAEQPAKVPRMENSLLHDQISLHQKGLIKSLAMEDEEKLKESNDLNSTIRPLQAPLVYAEQPFVPSVGILIKENGILGPCDRKNQVQHYQSGLAEQQVKIPRKENSFLHDQISLHRKVLVKSVALEDEKKLKESNDLNSTRRPPRPPVGAPFRPPRVGGKRKSLSSASNSTCGSSNYDNGELCDTEELRKLMEKVAEAQGIGVTLDSANLLNNALNTYLKRLIKSTVDLARVRSTHEPTKHPVNEKPLSGFWPGNHMHVQNSVESSLNVNNGHGNQYKISLQDFQVAMELNPQQLGQGWPLLLEKISMRSNEE